MALVNAKTQQGEPIVKGKQIACFTDAEEGMVGLTEKVPFLLEAKMKELGATVEVAAPWNDKAVRDGNLVTGQNPQSSVSVAKLCLEKGKRALIVCTSAAKMGDHDTGLWSEECTGPYYVFKDAGCDVTVCSISGGDVTIDAGSVNETFKTENDKRMEKEGNVIFKGTSKLADQDVTSYDIVLFSGGHGTCVDFPTDAVGAAVSKAASAGKVVAAVCHGPMALVNAKTEKGEPIVKGKKIACFTDKEEEIVGLTSKVPFLLEAKMKELGAAVEVADPWNDKAVRDGNLVTGQNPQSSVSVAKLCLQ
jgi:putative intracellular protease/amidase